MLKNVVLWLKLTLDLMSWIINKCLSIQASNSRFCTGNNSWCNKYLEVFLISGVRIHDL